MKQIEKINEELENRYKLVDAINGIGKLYFDSHEKKNQMGIHKGREVTKFYPNDSYDIQVCHYLTGSRIKEQRFAESVFNVELIVISKFVKFYHLMDVLSCLDISFTDFNPNTQQILKLIGAVEDYPELEAYSIKYSFTAKPSDFI